MEVITVPVLSDNYTYIVLDKQHGQAVLVDPVEPEKALKLLPKGATVAAVLTTHHHDDHAGGNSHLLKLLRTAVPVYGGDERVLALSDKLSDKQVLKIGALSIQALHTPCHTTGHLCYHVTHDEQGGRTPGCLFTGDTLFIGGCGRFFEGTADEMHAALTRLMSYPDETLIYPGHEYTASNLRFALSVDQTNQALLDKYHRVKDASCTVPSTVAEEKQTNPFVRVADASVQRELGSNDPVAVMAALRERKNNFK